MRKYLAVHKRLTLSITIEDKLGLASPSLTQTVTLVVPFKKVPAPEF